MVELKEQECSAHYLWFDVKKAVYNYGSITHFNRISSNNQRKSQFQLIIKTDSFSEKLIERVVREMNSARSNLDYSFENN